MIQISENRRTSRKTCPNDIRPPKRPRGLDFAVFGRMSDELGISKRRSRPNSVYNLRICPEGLRESSKSLSRQLVFPEHSGMTRTEYKIRTLPLIHCVTQKPMQCHEKLIPNWVRSFNVQNFAFHLNVSSPPQITNSTDQVNLLTPNVNYSGRTAPLTSKVAFYIFIQ